MYGSLYIYSYIIHPYLLRLVKFQNIDPSFLNIYIIYMYTIYIRYISSRELGGFSASGVFNIRKFVVWVSINPATTIPPIWTPVVCVAYIRCKTDKGQNDGIYWIYIYRYGLVYSIGLLLLACFDTSPLLFGLCTDGSILDVYIIYSVPIYSDITGLLYIMYIIQDTQVYRNCT